MTPDPSLQQVAPGDGVGLARGARVGPQSADVAPAALQSLKDDTDLKQDLHCDTIDTREEYEMKVGRTSRGRRACGVRGRAGWGRLTEGTEEVRGSWLRAQGPAEP